MEECSYCTEQRNVYASSTMLAVRTPNRFAKYTGSDPFLDIQFGKSEKESLYMSVK